jgi:hypothetical protein
LLHRRPIAERFVQFELPIWKFAYREEWKKIQEAVCEELQLLKLSAFPMSEEFSTSHRVAYSTPSDCNSSLLTIMQGWCFANGFSQDVL